MLLGHTKIEDCINAPTLSAIKVTIESFKAGIAELTRNSNRTAEAMPRNTDFPHSTPPPPVLSQLAHWAKSG